MKTKRLSRRAFLRGASKIAVALPALAAMQPTRVFGQEIFPKRLIIFFTPNGIVMDRWRPTGTSNRARSQAFSSAIVLVAEYSYSTSCVCHMAFTSSSVTRAPSMPLRDGAKKPRCGCRAGEMP